MSLISLYNYDACSLLSSKTRASSHRFSDVFFPEDEDNFEYAEVSLVYVREPQWGTEILEKANSESIHKGSFSTNSNSTSISRTKKTRGTNIPSPRTSILSLNSLHPNYLVSQDDAAIALNEIDHFLNLLTVNGYENYLSCARSPSNRISIISSSDSSILQADTLSSTSNIITNSLRPLRICKKKSPTSSLNSSTFSINFLEAWFPNFSSVNSFEVTSRYAEDQKSTIGDPASPPCAAGRFDTKNELLSSLKNPHSVNKIMNPLGIKSSQLSQPLTIPSVNSVPSIGRRSTPDFTLQTKTVHLRKNSSTLKRFKDNLQPGTKKYIYFFFLGFFVPLIWVFGMVVVLIECKTRPEKIIKTNQNAIIESIEAENESSKWGFLYKLRFWKLVVAFMSLIGIIEMGAVTALLILYFS
ncbi:hypothetical protein NADFUDRAFT_41190 [Nadsonia fulvescens var. elongata DSM 6958]|uniref:Uncharacterized protein n=1 Tax=Nadsonia fulvescens var. elongata DSM 6958 TaxID=857566 RepID=A0A1E3PM80_9ASCO|nr:hypothetical protein NADFUDRAFT_41190 [Nadsonia fulvescens var. elongata DSM 6958]